MSYDKDTQDRFWAKVKKSNGCWLWQGAKNTKGYGIFSIGDTTHRAIRVAYGISKGDIEDGKHVMHSCANTQCVNPKHLSLGTNAENQAEKATRAKAVEAIDLDLSIDALTDVLKELYQ